MSPRTSRSQPVARRLRNGLRVVATRMPETSTTSVALAVRAGSVFDPPGSEGLAHFLEHLIFKATEDYPRHELAAALQRCGNRFDPQTSKELISISGTVPAEKSELALDLIASVARRPLFDADDLETERRVVLEELRDWEDDPSKRIELLTDATLWGAHPLGRDVGGTRATVREITRGQVRRFYRRYFHPRNAVLSVAGPMEPTQMLAWVGRSFSGWRPLSGAAIPRTPPTSAYQPAMRRARRKRAVRHANTQQVWFAISTTTPSYPQGYGAVLRTQLAANMIGDGDGSRLWDGLRERLGLAYEVYATQDYYADIGVMSAMAAVGRGRAGVALREMQRILDETRHGFSAEEFERGREALASQIALLAEWNAETARRYAELALMEQPLLTPQHELDMLGQLRASEFNDFVKDNIHWDSAAMCAIGQGPVLAMLSA